jgi:hypothetical protein
MSLPLSSVASSSAAGHPGRIGAAPRQRQGACRCRSPPAATASSRREEAGEASDSTRAVAGAATSGWRRAVAAAAAGCYLTAATAWAPPAAHASFMAGVPWRARLPGGQHTPHPTPLVLYVLNPKPHTFNPKPDTQRPAPRVPRHVCAPPPRRSCSSRPSCASR